MTDSSEVRTSAPAGVKASENTENPELTAAVAFTGLFRKGFERFAEFQKYVLDLYADQAADMISAWKRFVPAVPVSGETFLYDLARQGIGYFVEVQKGMVDLVVRQSMIGIGAMKEIRTSVSQVAEKGYEPMIDAMDVLISNQESIIGMASSTAERFGELVSDAADYGVRRSPDNAALQQEGIPVQVRPEVGAPAIAASVHAGASSPALRRPNHVRRADGAKQKKG
jgi:hypothetical protein